MKNSILLSLAPLCLYSTPAVPQTNKNRKIMKSYSIKSVILAVFLIGMINPAEARFEDGQIINLRSALSTNRFVAPRNGSSSDGAYISIHSRSATSKQARQWQLEDAGGGYFYLKGLSGKVMEIKNGSNNAKTSVWLKRKSNSDAQKFKFQAVSNRGDYGFYIIPKINPNLVLDVKMGYTYEGAGIWTHQRNRSTAQKFYIRYAQKDYKIIVESISCIKEDDPGNEVELFGKIWTRLHRKGVGPFREDLVFNRSSSKSQLIDLREGQSFTINGSNTYSLLPQLVENNTIVFEILVDIFEHDGSSANEKLFSGDNLPYSEGLGRSKTKRIKSMDDDDDTELEIRWKVVEIR